MEQPTRFPRNVVGVCNARLTRLVAFIIFTITLIVCVIACLFAVWGYAEPIVAWRAMASLGIISGATAMFVALNEGFGPAIRDSSTVQADR